MEKQLSSQEIKNTFISKNDIDNILFKYKAKIDVDMVECENQRQRNAMAINYKQKIFTSLNIAFRRQIILSTEEAVKFYTDNDDVLNERIKIFLDTIEYINDTLNIPYIPDRLMVCSFLRINADTYNTLLNDPRADIGLLVKTQIRNLEELIISMTMNGLEEGLISGYAWKKMQLKAEFGGNEVKQVETLSNQPRTVLLATGEEVQKRMKSSYNFPELIEDKKDNNNS